MKKSGAKKSKMAILPEDATRSPSTSSAVNNGKRASSGSRNKAAPTSKPLSTSTSSSAGGGGDQMTARFSIKWLAAVALAAASMGAATSLFVTTYYLSDGPPVPSCPRVDPASGKPLDEMPLAAEYTLEKDILKPAPAGLQQSVTVEHQFTPALSVILDPLKMPALKGVAKVPGGYKKAYLAPYASYWAEKMSISNSVSRQSSTGPAFFAHRLHDMGYAVLYLIWRRASDILEPSANPDARAWPTAKNVGNFFRFLHPTLHLARKLFAQVCDPVDHLKAEEEEEEDLIKMRQLCAESVPAVEEDSSSTDERNANEQVLDHIRYVLDAVIRETGDLVSEAAEFAVLHLLKKPTDVVPFAYENFAAAGHLARTADGQSERKIKSEASAPFKINTDGQAGSDPVLTYASPEIQKAAFARVRKIREAFQPFGEWDVRKRFFNDVMGFRQAMWMLIHVCAEYAGSGPLALMHFLDNYVEYYHPCPICRARWREDGPALFGKVQTFDDVRIGSWLHHNDANMRIHEGIRQYVEGKKEQAGQAVVEVFSTDKRWPSCEMCPTCWADGLCSGEAVPEARSPPGGEVQGDELDGERFRFLFNRNDLLDFLARTYSLTL